MYIGYFDHHGKMATRLSASELENAVLFPPAISCSRRCALACAARGQLLTHRLLCFQRQEMMVQWATFHSLCDPHDKSIEGDAREQVLRGHITRFDPQPDEPDATADHVMIWSAWAAAHGLKHDKHGLGPGFTKLYKVTPVHSLLPRPSPTPSSAPPAHRS
jgi:hypothetical protein